MTSGTSTDADWATQIADTLESVVGTIRGKTTDKVVAGAKWIVIGTMLFGVAVVAFFALIVGSVRLVVNYLPWRNGAWFAYAVLGMLCLLAGLYVWRKRRPATAAR